LRQSHYWTLIHKGRMMVFRHGSHQSAGRGPAQSP
jgi:hypothetical protein